MSAVLTANSEAALVLLVKGFTPYSSLIARAIDSANPKFREPARQTKTGPNETDRPPDGNPPHENGETPRALWTGAPARPRVVPPGARRRRRETFPAQPERAITIRGAVQ